jgi:ABC-type bacteriocin/lantibiotic exporter with double-glycine peptidase domain
LPVILHWETNHFVLLERLETRGVVIVDPASGRRRVSLADFDKAFTGVVLLMRPGPSFRRQRRRRALFTRYMAVLGRSRAAIAQAFAFALMVELCEVALPAANQILIDHVIKPGRIYWLPVLSGLFALTALLTVLTRALRDRVLLLLTHALDMSLVCGFVQHLLALPVHFIEQRTAGDLLQRVEANSTLRDLSLSILRAGLDGMLVVSLSLLALAYDTTIGVTVVLSNFARLALVQWLNRNADQLTASQLALAGSERSVAAEGLSAPELVRAFHAQDSLIERFTDRLIRRTNASQELAQLSMKNGVVLSCFDVALTAFMLWQGGCRVINGSMTVGVLMAFMTLRSMLFSAVQSTTAALTGFLYARGIVARLDDVLDTQPQGRGTRDPGSISGALELRGVTFRHSPRAQPTLQTLDLTISPGEKIAIVGRTGAGKTTLARLLLGLVEPTSGAVRVDGADMRELDRARLMPQFGAVLQDGFFFDASIRENLCFGRRDYGEAALLRALALACLDGVVGELSAGLETSMGKNGERFSRGQRQRFALARALLGEPRILILDEATSSLDLPTEARLHRNLSELRCTRIVIAHRLKTVEDADRILVLDGGRISACGTYRELAAREGLFREMVRHVAA